VLHVISLCLDLGLSDIFENSCDKGPSILYAM
jgi:hypothetical protein